MNTHATMQEPRHLTDSQTSHIHGTNHTRRTVIIPVSVRSRPNSTAHAHRSKRSFRAKSCQSLPLALAVSKVAQILWRIDTGILKALGPIWDVTVQSVCIKNGTDSFSVCGYRRGNRRLSEARSGYHGETSVGGDVPSGGTTL